MIAHLSACAAIAVLGWQCLRYRRDWRKARFELVAAIQAGELLCVDLENLRTTAALLERMNYDLACQLHGRAAVDRAIAEAHDRGVN